ncbi:DgyrCDS11234 [Dimorphilus gyrociliatus]|uniref:DgyrCDS11234 n=1 Tax=Dimorphilus gyrociliatus TaxID=2664684 RepID=A0A7I8W2U9_9ANNE|nr:DgyrCDS11234 [Dimorphilus gyrociliatus]
MPLLERLQFTCAICRIAAYTLYRRLCCKGNPIPKREFNITCIGLDNSGKSSLLTLLCGEDDISDISPTTGFNIRCIQVKNCILNIKEIGGGEKVREFWSHYYQGAEGVIYFVDSSETQENLLLSREYLRKALENNHLNSLPWLIMCNCQDKPGAKSVEEIQQIMALDKSCLFGACSIKSVQDAREACERLIEEMYRNSSPEETALNQV